MLELCQVQGIHVTIKYVFVCVYAFCYSTPLKCPFQIYAYFTTKSYQFEAQNYFTFIALVIFSEHIGDYV